MTPDLMAEIKTCLLSCADYIEADCNARYKDNDGRIVHPVYERKYKRDMVDAVEARRLAALIKDNR